MHIISGNGLLHITARDSTAKTLKNSWPGTLVLVTIKVGSNLDLNLHKIMAELRASADEEIKKGTESEKQGTHYVSINNFFGVFAENKEEAINYRDRHLLHAIEDGKVIHLDFNGVKSAPHSFLSALLATPIKRLGMNSYKQIKIINAEPEIRETIDYIFDDNT